MKAKKTRESKNEGEKMVDFDKYRSYPKNYSWVCNVINSSVNGL